MVEPDQMTIQLQAFDQAWQDRRLQDAGAMLGDPTISLELAVELVMIDLEYRWKSANSLCSDDRGPCLLEDYSAMCPAIAGAEAMPMDLIAEEFHVRNRWGDEPPMEDYVRRFGESDEMIARLKQTLAGLQVAIVAVSHDGREQYRTEFTHQITIGRQSVGEPEPFAISRSGGRKKLVIAPLPATELSRHQIRITRTGPEQVKLENLSDQVAATLSFTEGLPCKQSRQAKLPVQIEIESYSIAVAEKAAGLSS